MRLAKIYVIKRDGRKETVMFDKITQKIEKLCDGLDMNYIDPPSITKEIITSIYPGITTVKLDNMAAEIAVSWSSKHPHLGLLAARIAVSNLHKETKTSFSDVMEDLYNSKQHHESDFCAISATFVKIVKDNAEIFDAAIAHQKDFNFDYFVLKNIVVNHLKRIDDKVVERPQHLLMRVAVGMCGENIDGVLEAYKFLSDRSFTLPFSSLARAGTIRQQLACPFSVTMSEDSIEGIYDTLKNCGLIARAGGELGLGVQCIRGMGSYIAGTNGNSNGLVPMLRVYNSMARYTHQGGQKALAKITIYLEPWHSDVKTFLDLKRGSGMEEGRARLLQYAILIPDIFMKRVEANENWSTMCPDACPGLFELWGEEFDKVYLKYEEAGRVKHTMKARDLWESILEGQIETGSPSILFKDAVNRKSPVNHLGTTKESNYDCCQMAPSNKMQPASSLSTIVRLETFVTPENQFNFEQMKEVVGTCVRASDDGISRNILTCTDDSLMKNRRYLGIGVSGLADVFIKMEIAFDSEEASILNKKIFETLYYGALTASCDLAKVRGTYTGYENSPLSKGLLSFDMWNVTPSSLHDWTGLKKRISEHGVRNAVLICQPTYTDSTLHLGCAPGVEPYETYIETGLMKMANVKIVHPLLVKKLTDLEIWTDDLEDKIIENNGSIQGLTDIPEEVRVIFRTGWELPQKSIMKMAADRAPFIDQSQSLVVRLHNVNYGKLTSMLFLAWNMGLKTGLYQLKTPMQSSLSTSKPIVPVQVEIVKNQEAMVCSLENKEDCLSCGA